MKISSKKVYLCLTCGKINEQLVPSGKTKSGKQRYPLYTCAPGHKVERFDSQGEYGRFMQLQMLQSGGAISHLDLHPAFSITINGVKICDFTADFSYFENNEAVVEDFKGKHWYRVDSKHREAYEMKVKLVWALYRRKVRVVQ